MSGAVVSGWCGEWCGGEWCGVSRTRTKYRAARGKHGMPTRRLSCGSDTSVFCTPPEPCLTTEPFWRNSTVSPIYQAASRPIRNTRLMLGRGSAGSTVSISSQAASPTHRVLQLSRLPDPWPRPSPQPPLHTTMRLPCTSRLAEFAKNVCFCFCLCLFSFWAFPSAAKRSKNGVIIRHI